MEKKDSVFIKVINDYYGLHFSSSKGLMELYPKQDLCTWLTVAISNTVFLWLKDLVGNEESFQLRLDVSLIDEDEP